MKKYLLRTENIMLGLVLVCLLVLEIYGSNSTVDVHLYDTYYVISNINFSLIFFIYSLIIYSIYFLLRKIGEPVSRSIAIFQITGLVIAILANSIPTGFSTFSDKPIHYYDYAAWNNFKKIVAGNKIVTTAAIIFIISQVIFFLYFIGMFVKSLIKRK